MKQFNNIIILFISFLSLASCESTHKKQENTNETPEAFQEQTVLRDVSTYSKRGKYETLVDKLYNELIEKDAELKEIEEEIKRIKTIPKTTYENIIKNNTFLENNSKYYNELKPFFNDTIVNLKSFVAKIQDSTLRNKMTKLTLESENRYISKVKKIDSLNELLYKKSIELNDYKTALKISATLKSMEKYQDNYKQDTTSLKELIQRNDDLINTMKNKINN